MIIVNKEDKTESIYIGNEEIDKLNDITPMIALASPSVMQKAKEKYDYKEIPKGLTPKGTIQYEIMVTGQFMKQMDGSMTIVEVFVITPINPDLSPEEVK